MKKATLYNLAQFGVGNITNHTLSPANAYKVVKFRKELVAALEALSKDEEALRKDAGIEDPQAFDKELQELRESKFDPKRLEEMEGILKRFIELRAELLNEEVTLDCKAMPYDEWHKLQVENADKEMNGKKVDLLPAFVEDALEGVLWVAPKEEE